MQSPIWRSESIDGAKDLGLRGFWMGYFGFRACPLGRVEPGVVEAAPRIERAADALNESLEAVIASVTSIGRPMFGANVGLPRFDDPVERLWQNCTTLREHRGGGQIEAVWTPTSTLLRSAGTPFGEPEEDGS